MAIGPAASTTEAPPETALPDRATEEHVYPYRGLVVEDQTGVHRFEQFLCWGSGWWVINVTYVPHDARLSLRAGPNETVVSGGHGSVSFFSETACDSRWVTVEGLSVPTVADYVLRSQWCNDWECVERSTDEGTAS